MQTLVLGGFLAASLLAAPLRAHEFVAASGRGEEGFSGVDAEAFHEMVFGESGRSLRWAQTPQLVVLLSVMQYRPGTANTYAATSERLTGEEANQLVVELTAALRSMTAGSFMAFTDVRFEVVETTGTTHVLRPGQIVVGRFRGVRDTANTIGLGGRSVRANGVITSGAVLLDRDYDRSSDQRRLLRAHELGHALGYHHVEARESIMNARIGTDVTEFDRRAASRVFRSGAVANHDEPSSATGV